MRLLFERILLEKHERSTAAERLAKSGMFGDPNDPKAMEEATNLVNKLSKGTRDADGNAIYPKIPAFDGARGWALKYILGVVRMIIEESGGNLDKAMEFINNTDNMRVFDKFITWVIRNRPGMGDPNKPETPSKEQSALDDSFINKMSFNDVSERVDEIEDELNNAESDGGEYSESSAYEIVPIDSFEQLNSMFGGRKTGRGGTSGKGIGYQTTDGGAWCHTNGKGTYDSWVEGGKFKFFILAKKGWQDVEPNFTNYGKNDYGHSLMALLVDTKKGTLQKCTLRVNHEGIDGGGFHPDKAYDTYAEISQITGFDVGKAIKDMLGIKPLVIKNGTIEYAGGEVTDAEGFDPEKDIEKIRKIIVKEGTTTISEKAFSGLTFVEEIIIPDGVTTIGDSAFSGCKSLRSINLPDGIETIGTGAFFESGITSISIPYTVENFGEFVFKNCVNLESAKLSDVMVVIPKSTFNGCSSLRNIHIGESVASIEQNAFAYCMNLTIDLPDSVSTVSRNAFFNCSNVVINTSVYRVYTSLRKRIESIIEADGECGFTVNYTEASSTDDIESVVYRGESMSVMYGDRISEIKQVAIPKGMSEICQNAFKNCVNLVGIHPQSDLSKISSIEDGAFENCEKLVAIDLHQMTDLWWIGNNAFKNCRSLGYIELPEGPDAPQDISNGCFEGCTSLRKVDCNNATRIIGENAFRGSGVVTVEGLDKVTEIKSNAFEGCGNLRVIVLKSKRVRNISLDAFNGCSSREGIYCASDYVENFCNRVGIPCVRIDQEGR